MPTSSDIGRPSDCRPRSYSVDMTGSTAPEDVLHNHTSADHIVYAGFSEKAPTYHLFRCVAHSKPPRKKVTLKAFDRQCFTVESKAGHGGCSIRNCPGEAVAMNKKETHAYCESCAQRARDPVPCPWTAIETCYTRQGLNQFPYGKPCPTCKGFEEVGT